MSLVEVLITLAILPLSVLSLLHLQTRAVQYSHSSMQRSMAMTQANDLVERLWSNACVLPSAFDQIKSDWQQVHASSLANWNGSGTQVSNEGDLPLYEVEVRWQDSRFADQSDLTDPRYVFSYTARIPQLGCSDE